MQMVPTSQGIPIDGIATLIVNIILALAVHRDGKRIGPGLFLSGPVLWGWAVFVSGILGVAVYWLVHHSTLRPTVPPGERIPTPEP